MPNPNSTLVVVVLDRSGSMAGLEEATLAGLNTFLRGQRSLEGETRLHLVQFDDQYEVHRDMANLKDSPDLVRAEYQPRGSTALLDAIGRTIQDVGNRLAAQVEQNRPGKVFFVIQTDGFENASREYNHARIQDLIAQQRDKYAWEFVFLGANQDAIASGAQLGIWASNSMSYNASPVSTAKTFQTLNTTVGSVRSGAMESINYTEAMRNYVADDSRALDGTFDLQNGIVGTGSEPGTEGITVTGTGGQPTTTPGSGSGT